ncbi:endonuclease/exonuclease/phosphatase family protein [Luteolibacter luteus]|uniref:Endonuclease/exonuclease/phosphatase family protein n=1 Tax=Luteolibacter luteus TaxID=2728835 RepID=A0A858RDK9_9BACT|nr:endonuclease/exonuclease/phosphatase family protein [Luteolibacter luteus]QJE94479.1 endonuclease/exonuclease/phosphatase family protein [Luteolibacter luteus]
MRESFRMISRRTILGLLALPLLLVSCREKEPPRAVKVSEEGSLQLTLASFNIRYEGPVDQPYRAWPNRIQGVVRTIRGIDPDVLGVQESLHGQCADLRASLPDYAFTGAGRDDGKESGEYSAIFYRKDRFEPDVTDRGMFWLSDSPEQPGSRTWGNEIPRVVTWIRLIDRATAKAFYVFNTHWDHRNQPSREKAAVLISKRINARAHADEPVVLLGDFNAADSNPAVAYFTGKQVSLSGNAVPRVQTPLLDVFRASPPPGGSQQTLHLWRPLQSGWPRIDHILVTNGAKVEATGIQRAKTIEERPSDHFPVWARITWP